MPKRELPSGEELVVATRRDIVAPALACLSPEEELQLFTSGILGNALLTHELRTLLSANGLDTHFALPRYRDTLRNTNRTSYRATPTTVEENALSGGTTVLKRIPAREIQVNGAIFSLTNHRKRPRVESLTATIGDGTKVSYRDVRHAPPVAKDLPRQTLITLETITEREKSTLGMILTPGDSQIVLYRRSHTFLN